MARYRTFFPFFLLLVAGALFFRWLDSPEIRYQRFPKIYDMIWNQGGEVDVVAIGSSRSARMFSADLLAEALAPVRPNALIYDLSRSFRGMDANYVMLRDFLSHRRAKILLIEFNILEHIDGMYSHKLLHEVGTIGDLFEGTCFWHTEERFYTGFHHSLRLMQQKLQYFYTKILSGGWRSLSRTEPSVARTDDYILPLDYVRPEKIEYMIEKAGEDWRMQDPDRWDITQKPELCEMHYLRRIMVLAEEKGAKVILYHITVNHGPPLAADFVHQVERQLGAPLLQMPEEELDRLYKAGGYGDPGHGSEAGSRLWMRWLATQLAPELAG